jgi:hypothetical protein
MTFLPHSTNSYYLPFHADEWIHWGYTNGFIDHGEIEFPNPFTGEKAQINPEIGFHVFLGCFKWISGAELRTIFLFMPSVLAVFTSLTAFCLGERNEKKFGLEAAFLVAFIPTSVRFLGPSFLVPLSLGLFLTLFSLLIAQYKGYKKYPLLLLLVFFATTVHPPAMIAMTITLLCYALFLFLEKKYWEGALIGIMVLITFVVSSVLILQDYFEMGINVFFGEKYISTLPNIQISFEYLGAIVWGLFFFASLMALYKGKAMHRGMFLAALAFIVIIFLYDRFTLGLPIIYDRSFTFLFLFITLLTGYGLAEVRGYIEGGVRFVTAHLKLFLNNKSKKKKLAWGISIALPFFLCLLIAFLAVPVHKEEAYYTLINDKEFEMFEWINNNIDEYKNEYHSFDKAVVATSKAPVFSSVTGIYTLSSSGYPRYGESIRADVDTFFVEKGRNTDFLENYDIDVVYGNTENEILKMVHKNVYLYYGMPPTADFTFTPEKPREKDIVTFISNSTTPFGSITTYSWNFDGENITTDNYLLKFKGEYYAKAKMKMSNNFAIDMWLKPSFSYDDGENHELFIWYGKEQSIMCYKHPNGRMYFAVKGKELGVNGENYVSFNPIIEFEANTWHHFAVVYAGWTGTITIYWDGEIVEAADGGGYLLPVNSTVRIGGWRNRWFKGFIRDVRIYRRTLSDMEVAENYQGNITKNDLASWWKFDEGVGSVAKDSIGNNDAVILGATWINYYEHIYDEEGEYEVTLTVRNEDGLSDSISKKIVVYPS